MTSGMAGQERAGRGVQPHDQWHERSWDLNHMTTDKLGRKGHPGGRVLVFPVLLVARYPGLSAQVTFRSWPIVPTLFMSVELPTT